MNLAVRNLCRGLSELGIPTDVFVRRDSADLPAEQLIAPGSRLVRIDAGPASPLEKSQLHPLVPEFVDAVAAHARSERRSYRVVHGHYWLGGAAAAQLRELWEVPWVQSFHTLARTKARAGLPGDSRRAAAEEQMVRNADRLVAGSVAEARDLIRLYRAPRSRICVAEPGVDLTVLHPHSTDELRRSLGIDDRRVVLFAGRLEPLKGADVVIEALSLLRSRPGFDDLDAVIVGEESGDGGGERRRLEVLASTRGVGDHVRFVGAVAHADLGTFYELADVCAMPSRSESFGLVALEAQALGTPVVATAVGGLTEIVEDGVTGRLVQGRDARRFADALGDVLGDEGRRREMGERARERARRYTWARATQRLAAIYDRLTGTGLAEAGPCGDAEAEVS